MIGCRIAYVLDPYLAVLRQSELSDRAELTAIEAEIGCDAVDSIRYDADHTLFFDDSGLRDGITHYTRLEGYPDPLVGKLVLLHSDSNEQKPTLSMQDVLARFQCYRAVMDPIIKTSSTVTADLTNFISGVTGFTLRIEQFSIAIR